MSSGRVVTVGDGRLGDIGVVDRFLIPSLLRSVGDIDRPSGQVLRIREKRPATRLVCCGNRISDGAVRILPRAQTPNVESLPDR